MKRAAIYIVSFVVVLSVGAGAHWYWLRVTFESPLPTTQGGVAFEQLLPPETSLVLSYNPSDREERVRFEKLWSTVLQDKKDALLPFFATQSSLPITLDDLLIFFGDDFRFLVGFVPPKEKKDPTFYSFISVQDPGKARAFFEERMSEALIETPPHVIRDANGEWLVASPDGSFLVGLVKDTVFATNATEEQALKVFQRASSRIPASFIHTDEFRASAEHFKNPLSGYVYMAFVPGVDFNAFRFTASTFRAQDDGLRFDSISETDHEKIEASNLAALVAPYQANLYKKFPAEQLIAYFEAQGFDGVLLAELQFFGQAFGMTQESMLNQFKTATGLDFETDVRPLFSRGFALGWSDTGGIIPGFSLVFDASAAPDKGKMLMEKLHAALGMWSSMGNMSIQTEDKTPLFDQQAIPTLPAGGAVTMHVEKLPREEANIPLLDVIAKPIEFSYGITEDHRLFFSLTPKFAEQLSRANDPGITPENTPGFKKLQTLAAGETLGSIGFFDSAAFGSYGKNLMLIIEQFGTMDAGAKSSFELLAKHLSPIKGFTQVSSSDGEHITGVSFLEIR